MSCLIEKLFKIPDKFTRRASFFKKYVAQIGIELTRGLFYSEVSGNFRQQPI